MAGVRWRGGLALVVALVGVLIGLGLWYAWPRVFPNLVAQGIAAYGRDDWREASLKANQQLDRTPHDRQALRLLARASARLGYDAEAQAIYRRLGSTDMQWSRSPGRAAQGSCTTSSRAA